MISTAAARRKFCARIRWSTNAAARLMHSTMEVTAAIATASSNGDNEEASTAVTRRKREGGNPEHDSQDNGGGHQQRIPVYVAGKLDRRHACVVHCGDAAPDDAAAYRCPPSRRPVYRNREPA